MSDRLFTDETIQKHIAKYGKECYVQEIQERLKTREVEYKRGKKKLEHILERIEKNFK